MSFRCEKCDIHADYSPIVHVTERREKKYTNSIGGATRDSIGHEIVKELRLCLGCSKEIPEALIPYGVFEMQPPLKAPIKRYPPGPLHSDDDLVR